MSPEESTEAVRADFEAAIRRHFGDLFDQHGFEVSVRMNERAGEYQMVVATSAVCKVKWKLEQDSFTLLFARLDAPEEWADEIPEGHPVWFAVQLVMVYEDRLHPARAKTLPPGRDPDDLEDVLDAYATLTRAYLDRILRAFGPSPPHGWWDGFDAFMAERLEPGPVNPE